MKNLEWDMDQALQHPTRSYELDTIGQAYSKTLITTFAPIMFATLLPLERAMLLFCYIQLLR